MCPEEKSEHNTPRKQTLNYTNYSVVVKGITLESGCQDLTTWKVRLPLCLSFLCKVEIIISIYLIGLL